MTISQISHILEEAQKIPGLKWIYFGGGEPFTQYPLLLKAVQKARKKNFEVGVETNGYFARSVETGVRFLRPLAQLGVKNIRISNDDLHYKNPWNSPALRALTAAKELGLTSTLVQVDRPGQDLPSGYGVKLASQVDKRRLMFCGRASETLAEEHAKSKWDLFDSCPRTDLLNPEEMFLDAHGYLQICPGIAVGNAWKTPLHIIARDYDPSSYPILNSLYSGGPAGLARDNTMRVNNKYVEPCHFCYSLRKELTCKFPQYLAPNQVYGL